MISCYACGAKLGFFNRKIIGWNKNRIFICKLCYPIYKKKIKIIHKVMKSYFGNPNVNTNSGVAYHINDKGNVIYSTDLITRLDGKELTINGILRAMEIEKETIKLKEGDRKHEIREEAEKELYGEVRKLVAIPQEVRKIVFKRYNNICATCNEIQNLHIHHKDRNRRNNRLSNLILLCGKCHKKIHKIVR